jgi:hypothetical protein
MEPPPKRRLSQVRGLNSCYFPMIFTNTASGAGRRDSQDLLPRPKVESPVRDCHHHLAAHHLSFQVGVAVVLAGAVVAIAADRLVRCQLFQPLLVIGVQAPLVVVDEHAGGDMHGVYKGQHIILHMPLSFR